ncbi:hypothetical protein ACIA8C_11670 [Nocardia sp. NPDC051321]|uniref:hypothetical protein n=1 Tax=Nocardia sp. NPDC051321 TaxID=3364323 RepID=UPI0037914CCA
MSTIGEYFQSTVIRGIDEGIGGRGLVQSLHGTPRDGSLELATGTVGDRGKQGEPAPAFRWEGDIADQAALDALAGKLGPAQAGKAWRMLPTAQTSDTLVFWNGTSFDTFVDAFGAAGPDGQPCTVTIGTVDTGPIGSDLVATITGTAPNLTLNLTVPRGVKGRKGDQGGPGPIRQAPDYADGPHVDLTVPMWDAAIGKWVGRPYPGLRGPWSVVEGQAWDGGPGFAPTQSNINTTPNTVAVLKIPAQDTDWRPLITGGCVTMTGEGSADTRIDAEVHLGSASGQIVALGSGLPQGANGFCRFQPFYGAHMTPESTVGVVPAGQAVALYVVLKRAVGNANYTYLMAGAQIVCWVRPVGKTQGPAA